MQLLKKQYSTDHQEVHNEEKQCGKSFCEHDDLNGHLEKTDKDEMELTRFHSKTQNEKKTMKTFDFSERSIFIKFGKFSRDPSPPTGGVLL